MQAARRAALPVLTQWVDTDRRRARPFLDLFSVNLIFTIPTAKHLIRRQLDAEMRSWAIAVALCPQRSRDHLPESVATRVELHFA